MSNNYNILYIGIDPHTPSIISKNRLHLTAVAELEYFSTPGFNPGNIIFKLIYYFHKNKRFPYIKRALIILFKRIKMVSSGPFKKYSGYLLDIVCCDSKIINIENENATINFIKNNNIDLIVVNMWSIIPQSIINSSRFGTLNIHPSKLPKYKGALPTLWALKNKEDISAVTYIIINEKIDGGNIVAQYDFKILNTDSWLQIENRVMKIIQESLYKDILDYIEGKKELRSQLGPSSITGKYYEYKFIKWRSEDEKEIYNKVNSYPYLEPYAYCYSYIDGRKIFFKKINIGSEKIPAGYYSIYWFYLYIGSKKKSLIARLFIDIPIKNSVFLLLTPSGKFDS